MKIDHPQTLTPAAQNAISGTASSDWQALFDEIAAGSAEREEKRILPFAQIQALKDQRFGAYRLPLAEGGTGASIAGLMEQVIALGAADSNVAHILRNHFVFVERFARNPVSAQAHFWREQVAQGAIFGLANTELAQARSGEKTFTRLVPDGAHFRMTGAKFYSTGSLYADFVIVRARDAQERDVTAIIPTRREGVNLVDDWDAMGQRMTGSGTTLFENVRVEPEEIIVDSAGTGYSRPYKSTLPQLFLTAVNTGILRAIVRDASAMLHKRSRKGFFFAAADTPAEDPLLLKIVGDLSAQLFAAEAVVTAASHAQDASLATAEGDPALKDTAHHAAVLAAKAKLIVDGLVLQAGTAVFDLGGASSTLRTQNLDRHWRNARTVASHNPALYKALALGKLAVHGEPLPDKDFF